MLWHGLGRVRERRGPVSQSAPHFRTAAELLERGSYPAEVAESLIGPVRVVYQNGASSPGELIEARDVAADARRLAGSLTDQVAMQLSEQANALVWLITQKLAQRETDLTARAAALAEVRDNLWLSYERRRRILRPEPRPEPGSNPALEDGLGSERAFFNLAGVNIQLAKIHHKMANVTGAQRDAALAEVAEDLDQAARVYEVVRELREQRYQAGPTRTWLHASTARRSSPTSGPPCSATSASILRRSDSPVRPWSNAVRSPVAWQAPRRPGCCRTTM